MKTPEEMAMEYIKDVETARNPSVTATAFPQMQRCFLAGYKAAQQWISVKDHYPAPSNDDCDPKLVAIKAANGYVFDVADTAHGCLWADKLGENVEHESHEVTHWMPLPAPPKEEK